jgi:hypothetical protein
MRPRFVRRFVVARTVPTSISDMSDIAHAAEATRAAARPNREGEIIGTYALSM